MKRSGTLPDGLKLLKGEGSLLGAELGALESSLDEESEEESSVLEAASVVLPVVETSCGFSCRLSQDLHSSVAAYLVNTSGSSLTCSNIWVPSWASSATWCP